MLIENMPFPEYLALDRVSSHRLMDVLRSPLKMQYSVEHPEPASESMRLGMRLGTLFHDIMAGENTAVVKPDNANKRSNEGKKNLITFLESATGHQAPHPPKSCRTASSKLDHQIQALYAILDESAIEIYTAEQMDIAQQMREQFMRKPIARMLFESGRAEVTCLQTDPDTHLELKARFDQLPDHHPVIVDLKTCRDASHAGFSRDAARYSYPLQMSFYQWIYYLETGEWLPIFLAAVETNPPYDSVIYEVDEAVLEFGRMQYMRALEIYTECFHTGTWPGYDWDWDRKEHVIQTLTLPKWAYEI